MGDVRFERPYERVRDAKDRVSALRSLTNEEVVAALAAASRARDPLLANVLATEAHNRILRTENLASVLRAAPDATLVLDESGTIRFANAQAERLYGYTAEQLAHKDVFELLPERQREAAREQWSAFVEEPRGGVAMPAQAAMGRRSDGSEFPTEVTMNPLRSDTGLLAIVSVRAAAIIPPEGQYQPSARAVRALSWIARVSAAFVAALASTVLAGWILDIAPLRLALPSLPSMVANTAAGLLVAATGLWLLGPREGPAAWRRRGAIACGAAVLLLGLATLAQYVVGDLGIDALLIGGAIPARPRPSPQTAAVLALVGAAIVLLAQRPRSARAGGQTCTAAAGLIALLGLSGYLYGVVVLYQWPPIVPNSGMSIPTAIASLALAAGLLAARPIGTVASMARASSGGLLLRRVVPVALTLPLAIGALVAYGVLRGFYDHITGFAIFAVCVIAGLTWVLDRSARRIDAIESERVRAEILFRGLMHSAPDAMIVADKGGTIRYANDQAGRMFGYTGGELLGRPLETLLPERVHARHAEHRGHYAADARTRRMGSSLDTVGRRSNGEEFPVEVTLSPIQTDEGLLVAAAVRDVTERKRTESDLRQMSALVEQTDDLLVVTDRSGRIQYVNPSFEQKTGYAREEAIGQTPRILRSGEQEPSFYAAMWRTILAGRVFRGRLVNRRKNGELYVEEKTITPLRDERGDITSFVSSGKDITIERRAEEARARLAAIVETTPDGIMHKSLDGIITSWNSGCERIFGWTAEEAIGRPSTIFVPAGGEAGEREILDRAARGEPQVLDEVARVSKDGTRVWVSAALAPVRDEKGSVVGVSGIYHDITQRRKIQERLDHVSRLYRIIAAASEATFRATTVDELLANVCEVMATRDGFDMVWVGLVDQATETLRPVAKAGDVGAYLDGLVIGVGHGAPRGPSWIAVHTGEPATSQDIAHDPAMAPWRDKALASGFASSIAVPILSEGRVVGTVNVYSHEVGYFDPEEERLLVELAGNVGLAIESMHIKRDRDAAEANLRQSHEALEARVAERTRELRAAYADLEAFSATVSHDLRAPLRGIETFTRILEEEHADQLEGDARESLARIDAETKRMRRLIDDLLSYSRASQSAYFPETVDLTTMAEEIVASLRARDPARSVEVVIDRGLVAQADPKLLHIALENLIGNAWKFTSKRRDARIHVGSTLSATGPTFFVADNGAGFDATKAATLFQPFRRLHSGEFEGTGLGLATVRRIIERHGGSVWAEGRLGEGATVWFSLVPLATSEAIAGAATRGAR